MKQVSLGAIFFLLFPVTVLARPISNEILLEQMNKQFEQVNLRLEQMNKQFEQVNLRFEELEKRMDMRFAEADKRFEQLQREMDKRFEQVDKRFEAMQYFLIALLTAVIGMPFLARKWERARDKEIDELRRFLIAMKELATTDEKLAKAFKAAGLL